MAWDANSREVLESFFSSWNTCKDCKPCDNVQLVTDVPPIGDSIQAKINKKYSASGIYGLIEATDRTIKKFEEVIEEQNPEYKIKILDQTCEICYQYGGDHDSCVYEKRCKERFNDMTSKSPEDMDKFAKEEIEFCELLKTYLFLRLDSLGIYDKPGGVPITSKKENLILEAYDKGMNISKAAEYAGVSHNTVRRHWKIHELDITTHKSYNKISEEKEQKILEARDKGMNASEAAKYADVCYNTVKKYWKKWS